MCYCPTPTLHLNLALTGDGAFLFSLKKTHSVWFISILNYGDTENVLINHLLLVTQIQTQTQTQTHTHTHRHRHRHRHTHTQTQTHTHTHTHMHTHTHHSLKSEHAVVDVWAKVYVIVHLAVAQLPDLNILDDKVQHVWNFSEHVSFYRI